MKVEMNLVGDKQLDATLNRQKIRIKKEASKICLAEAEAIMAESALEVPRDTGALADSAFISQGSDGNVTFGYGALNTQINPKTGKPTNEYMVTVHEDLNTYHPVGKAKFLEDPVNRRKEPLLRNFIKKLRRAFKL